MLPAAVLLGSILGFLFMPGCYSWLCLPGIPIGIMLFFVEPA